MTTILLPPDPMTTACTALRWTWRGDLDLAQRYLGQLTDAERAEARMHALRLAALIQAGTPEGVALAALTPDSPLLPGGES